MSVQAQDFLGAGWVFPVTVDAGDIATAAYEEDVRQAILVILGTEPGERIMRPDFGAGLRSLTFEPVTTATAALVRHRVETALLAQEPRIDVVSVTVQATEPVMARLDVSVSYRVRATNTFYNIVYPFYLQQGSP